MSKLRDKIRKEFGRKEIFYPPGPALDVVIDVFEKELADMRKEMLNAIARSI